MGIEKAFDYQNADFSLMLKNYPERMIIEAILQKAMIDVDEKGTEAAAATVIITKISGYRSEEPIEFKADKPFTYYTILDYSGNVYFAGWYVKKQNNKKSTEKVLFCYFSILTVSLTSVFFGITESYISSFFIFSKATASISLIRLS